MHRLFARFGAAFLLLVMGSSTGANAQQPKPADLIPDSASFVGRWKSPQASLARLGQFVDAVQPGFGVAVTSSLRVIGQPLGIPELKGVDVNEDIWIIVFAESQQIPLVVTVVTATDVAEVKAALSPGYQSHAVGKLVLFSTDEAALAEVKNRASDKGKSLWSEVGVSSKTLFDAADLAILFNVKKLTEDFADELNDAVPQFDDWLDRITNLIPAEQKPQMEAVFGMYRDLGKALLHGIRDTKSWTLGLTFSKESIRYEDRIDVSEGSDTAKFLAKQPAGDLAILNSLPADKAAYIGIKFDLSNMIDWAMKMSKSILTTATPEQLAQFDEAAKEMRELKYQELSMYMDLAGKSPAVRMGAITLVTPGLRAREISRNMQSSMKDFRSPQFTQTTKLEMNAENVGGNEVDLLTIKQTFENAVDPQGMQARMQAVLYGEEGMQQRLVYQPDRAFQTMGGGSAELQSLLSAATSANGKTSAVATARKAYLEKANLLVMLDVAKLMSSGLKLANEQSLMSVDIALLEKTKLDPSYIGFALGCEPTSIRSQLEIPAGQVQNIMKLVPLFRPRQ